MSRGSDAVQPSLSSSSTTARYARRLEKRPMPALVLFPGRYAVNQTTVRSLNGVLSKPFVSRPHGANVALTPESNDA